MDIEKKVKTGETLFNLMVGVMVGLAIGWGCGKYNSEVAICIMFILAFFIMLYSLFLIITK